MNRPVVHVVDDDASMRSALVALFESAALEARSYESAEAFLDALVPTTTGCLVLDGHMSGMSGVDLLRSMKGRGCALPVLYLTGYGDARTLADVANAGAVDICIKPIAGDLLLDKVKAIIGR